MDATTIRVREPRELLALLPFQLGFRPQESAVAVSLRPPRGRVGLVARVDLSDLGDLDRGPQLARGLVSHLASDGAKHAVLVIYTGADPRSGVAGHHGGQGRDRRPVAAVDHFREAAEPFLGDVAVWVVTPTGYLSLDCRDAACCPVGGRPLRDLDGTMVGAQMVLAGAMVEDSRENLARIRPAAAAARRNTTRVARRWKGRRSAAAAANGPSLDRWRSDALGTWRAALDESLVGRPPLEAAVLGRIQASLADVRVRDAILLTLVPGTGDLAERSLVGFGGRPAGSVESDTSDALGAILDAERGVRPDEALSGAGVAVLEQLVAHTGGAPLAPPLTLLAILAWWGADGARAGVLLDRALDADPAHRLALLLGEALVGGMSPGWVRRSA